VVVVLVLYTTVGDGNFVVSFSNFGYECVFRREQALKEKLKVIQSKITSRNERIKLLMLSGVPSPHAVEQ
jgi:hypothetical protein